MNNQTERLTASTCNEIAALCQERREYLIEYSDVLAASADAIERFKPATDDPDWLAQIVVVVDSLRNAAISLRSDEITMRRMKVIAMEFAKMLPDDGQAS